MSSRMSHKLGLALLALLVLAFFHRVVFLGHVVFPHDNTGEMGLVQPRNPERLSSERFTDASLIYVPSVHHSLNGERSGWLVTWDPHVELGKPANQLAGLNKGFLPMHVVSLVTDDAFVAYTLLTVLAVVLSALFGYLFLKELGLHPAACFAGAVGLGLGYFTSYWLTFAIFVWGVAWTMALLWGIERFVKRPGLGGFVWIVFAVHALFLSAYPQAIVWNGYVVAAFSLVRVLRVEPRWGRRVGLLAALGGAALVGLASVAPAYLDLVFETQRSGRTELDPNFFVQSLPEFRGLGEFFGDMRRFELASAGHHGRQALADVGFYLRRLYDDLWYGNPVRSDHVHVKLGMKGLCFTPVLLGLFALSFAGGLKRRVWGWQAFVAFTAVMTAWPALYAFGVEHLGLSFSRWLPLGASWIPIVVLGAFAADHVLRGTEPVSTAQRVARVALCLAPAALALLGTLSVPETPSAGLVAVSLALTAGVALFAWTGHPAWIVAAAAAGALHYGLALSLTRPPEEIAVESPLVDGVRRLTSGGRRYALVDQRTRVLRPNLQPLLGIRTIHAYDSLTPGQYREWAIRLNGDGDQLAGRTDWQQRKLLPSFGRVFSQIEPSPALGGPMLSFAGTSVLLCQVPTEIPGTVRVAPGLFQLERAALLEAQLAAFDEPAPGEVAVEGFLQDAPRHPVERARDDGDVQVYRTTPAQSETVLFVSQQHHPYWSARDAGTGRELATVRVNGLYQGVRLPPGTSRVELRFEPRARWSWVPQLAFVLAGLVVLLRGVFRRPSRAPSSES